jgi:DNA mismatch repair protein MutS
MVEMSELATILDHATDRSLVLLDEVGRGTSTADGEAIAQAVTEHVHDEVGAWLLFATHHHDLTAVAGRLDRACNLCFETSRTGEGVTFEHSVARGSADASYGVEVAATAGIDEGVVDRARALLDDSGTARSPERDTNGDSRSEANGDGRSEANGDSRSETGSSSPPETNGSTPSDGSREHTDGESVPGDVRETLRDLDVATTTPLEALETLAALKRQLDDEQ